MNTKANDHQESAIIIKTVCDENQESANQITTGSDGNQESANQITTGSDGNQESANQITTGSDGNQESANQITTGSDEIKKSINQIATGSDENQESANRITAPDGGWGWMCVLGCTLNHFLMSGMLSGFAVFYIHIQDKYDASAAATSWIRGASSAFMYICCPIATSLSQQFTARRMGCIGGLIIGLSYCLSSVAPSAYFLYFSFSLLSGIGLSLVYAPSLVIVTQYFDKHRGLALSISTCGMGVGILVLPLLLEGIFQMYGLFGMWIIYGAISLNIIVSSSLLRPLEVHLGIFRSRTKHGTYHPPGSTDRSNAFQITYISSTINTVTNYVKQFKNLLANPIFLLFSCGTGLFFSSYVTGLTFIIALARERGIEEKRAVFLLSQIGICEIVGRFLSGPFLDIDIFLIRKYRGYWYSMWLTVGLAIHFALAYVDSYSGLSACCCLMSLFNGPVNSQRNTILVDLLGIEKVSNALGMTMFMSAAFVLVGPAFAGYMKDITGTYSASYIFTGITGLVAGLFITASVAYKKHSDTARQLCI